MAARPARPRRRAPRAARADHRQQEPEGGRPEPATDPRSSRADGPLGCFRARRPGTLQSVARVAGRVAKGHNRSRSARCLRRQAWHVRGSCARGRVAAVTAAGNLLPARTTTAFLALHRRRKPQGTLQTCRQEAPAPSRRSPRQLAAFDLHPSSRGARRRKPAEL